MSAVEHATVGGSPDFPMSWGLPPGRQYSEERAVWVRAHVRAHMRDPWVALRKLADSDRRLDVMLRMAELRQRARAEHR